MPPVSAVSAKTVFLGASGVGKSSIVLRLIKNHFNEFSESTIGASFLTKTVTVPERPLEPVKLEIWDTAGQERYDSLLPMYYRGASVVLLIYDVGNRESFENAVRKFEKVSEISPPPLVVLVANKVDSISRCVGTEEGAAFAAEHGMLFREVSAKTGQQVAELFEDIGRKVLERPRKGPREAATPSSSAVVVITTEPEAPAPAGCCGGLSGAVSSTRWPVPWIPLTERRA